MLFQWILRKIKKELKDHKETDVELLCKLIRNNPDHANKFIDMYMDYRMNAVQINPV